MKLRNALVALGLGLLTCHQAILTAPDGSEMTVVVNPPFIPANGGVSVVSAHIFEPAGTPVPDGTVVQFFTTLGHIDEQGKTNDGVARVNLVSDSHSGTAAITAISGPVVNKDAEVRIGATLPSRVEVTANPTRITSSRSSHIFAYVYDLSGNPVPNISVIFKVGSPAPPTTTPTTTTTTTPPTTTLAAATAQAFAGEWMDSGGSPVFTDNNGRAEDVLRTDYPRDAVQKPVTVTATTSNGQAGFVTVLIN